MVPILSAVVKAGGEVGAAQPTTARSVGSFTPQAFLSFLLLSLLTLGLLGLAAVAGASDGSEAGAGVRWGDVVMGLVGIGTVLGTLWWLVRETLRGPAHIAGQTPPSEPSFIGPAEEALPSLATTPDSLQELLRARSSYHDPAEFLQRFSPHGSSRVWPTGIRTWDRIPWAVSPTIYTPDDNTGFEHFILVLSQVLKERPALFEARRVLDMGVGSGPLAGYALGKGAGAVVGIDINPAAIPNTELNLAAHFPETADRFTGYTGDLWEALPADEPAFDVILFSAPLFNLNPRSMEDYQDHAGEQFSTIRRFLSGLPAHLSPRGVAYLRIQWSGEQPGIFALPDLAAISDVSFAVAPALPGKQARRGSFIIMAITRTDHAAPTPGRDDTSRQTRTATDATSSRAAMRRWASRALEDESAHELRVPHDALPLLAPALQELRRATVLSPAPVREAQMIPAITALGIWWALQLLEKVEPGLFEQWPLLSTVSRVVVLVGLVGEALLRWPWLRRMVRTGFRRTIHGLALIGPATILGFLTLGAAAWLGGAEWAGGLTWAPLALSTRGADGPSTPADEQFVQGRRTDRVVEEHDVPAALEGRTVEQALSRLFVGRYVVNESGTPQLVEQIVAVVRRAEGESLFNAPRETVLRRGDRVSLVHRSLWQALHDLKKSELRGHFVSIEFRFAEYQRTIQVEYETRLLRGRGNPEALVITAPYDATAAQLIRAVATAREIRFNQTEIRLIGEETDSTHAPFVQFAQEYHIPLDVPRPNPDDANFARAIARTRQRHPELRDVLDRPDVLVSLERFFYNPELSAKEAQQELRGLLAQAYARFDQDIDERVNIGIDEAQAQNLVQEVNRNRGVRRGAGTPRSKGHGQLVLGAMAVPVALNVAGVHLPELLYTVMVTGSLAVGISMGLGGEFFRAWGRDLQRFLARLLAGTIRPTAGSAREPQADLGRQWLDLVETLFDPSAGSLEQVVARAQDFLTNAGHQDLGEEIRRQLEAKEVEIHLDQDDPNERAERLAVQNILTEILPRLLSPTPLTQALDSGHQAALYAALASRDQLKGQALLLELDWHDNHEPAHGMVSAGDLEKVIVMDRAATAPRAIGEHIVGVPGDPTDLAAQPDHAQDVAVFNFTLAEVLYVNWSGFITQIGEAHLLASDRDGPRRVIQWILRQIHRILRPGGNLYLAMTLDERHNLGLGVRQWESLLQAAGFTDIQVVVGGTGAVVISAKAKKFTAGPGFTADRPSTHRRWLWYLFALAAAGAGALAAWWFGLLPEVSDAFPALGSVRHFQLPVALAGATVWKFAEKQAGRDPALDGATRVLTDGWSRPGKHGDVSLMKFLPLLFVVGAILGLFGEAALAWTHLGMAPLVLATRQRPTRVEQFNPILKDQRVVEVAMELALPHGIERALLDHLRSQGLSVEQVQEVRRAVAMSNSVGGIGPLIRERVILQSRFGIRVAAVTPLYETVWVQGEPGRLEPTHTVPIGETLRAVLEDTGIVLPVTLFDGTAVKMRVWKAPREAYSGAEVYFLDAPEVFTTVYVGKKDAPTGTEDPEVWWWRALRKQEWLLGRGTLALHKALGRTARPDLVVLNEAAAAFAMHRLVQDQFQNDPFFTETLYLYNDHTPIYYAHPKWTPEQMLRLRVDQRYVNGFPAHAVEDGRMLDTIDITRLLWLLSDQLFGVSLKHAQTIANMAGASDVRGKVRAVTNGVSIEEWQDPRLRDPDVVGNDERLWAVKTELKERMIRFLAERLHLDENMQEHLRQSRIGIWLRRITAYKRLDLLVEVLQDPTMREAFLQTGLIYVVGGRVHQDDAWAKDQVARLETLVASDPRLQRQILILRDYNVWDAPVLFQGADFVTMISNPRDEAASTGPSKGGVGGALVIATSDGVVPEFIRFYGIGKRPNGFLVPYDPNGHPTPAGLLQALKTAAEATRDRSQHLEFMRNALAWDPERRQLEQPHPMSLEHSVSKQAELYVNAIQKRDVRAQYYALGHGAGRRLARGMMPVDARRLLQPQKPFVWEFLYNMTTPWQIRETTGLVAFKNALREMQELGSIGEWVILRRSADSVEVYGDLEDHVLSYFPSDAPSLQPGLQYLRELGTQIEAIRRTKQDPAIVDRKLLERHRQLEGFLEAYVGRAEALVQKNRRTPLHGMMVLSSLTNGSALTTMVAAAPLPWVWIALGVAGACGLVGAALWKFAQQAGRDPALDGATKVLTDGLPVEHIGTLEPQILEEARVRGISPREVVIERAYRQVEQAIHEARQQVEQAAVSPWHDAIEFSEADRSFDRVRPLLKEADERIAKLRKDFQHLKSAPGRRRQDAEQALRQVAAALREVQQAQQRRLEQFSGRLYDVPAAAGAVYDLPAMVRHSLAILRRVFLGFNTLTGTTPSRELLTRLQAVEEAVRQEQEEALSREMDQLRALIAQHPVAAEGLRGELARLEAAVQRGNDQAILDGVLVLRSALTAEADRFEALDPALQQWLVPAMMALRFLSEYATLRSVLAEEPDPTLKIRAIIPKSGNRATYIWNESGREHQLPFEYPIGSVRGTALYGAVNLDLLAHAIGAAEIENAMLLEIGRRTGQPPEAGSARVPLSAPLQAAFYAEAARLGLAPHRLRQSPDDLPASSGLVDELQTAASRIPLPSLARPPTPSVEPVRREEASPPEAATPQRGRWVQRGRALLQRLWGHRQDGGSVHSAWLAPLFTDHTVGWLSADPSAWLIGLGLLGLLALVLPRVRRELRRLLQRFHGPPAPLAARAGRGGTAAETPRALEARGVSSPARMTWLTPFAMDDIFASPVAKQVFERVNQAIQTGQVEEAIRLLQEVLVHPDLSVEERVNFKLVLAQSLVYQEQFDEGIRLLQQVVEQVATWGSAFPLAALANAYLMRGEARDDHTDLETARSLLLQTLGGAPTGHPVVAFAHERLMDVHLALGELDSAADELGQVDALATGEPEPYLRFARKAYLLMVRRKRNPLGHVLGLLQALGRLKALPLTPGQARDAARFSGAAILDLSQNSHLGDAHQRAEWFAQAVEDWERAVSLGEAGQGLAPDPGDYIGLAVTLTKDGRFDEAKRVIQRGLKRLPGDAHLLQFLDELKRHRGPWLGLVGAGLMAWPLVTHLVGISATAWAGLHLPDGTTSEPSMMVYQLMWSWLWSPAGQLALRSLLTIGVVYLLLIRPTRLQGRLRLHMLLGSFASVFSGGAVLMATQDHDSKPIDWAARDAGEALTRLLHARDSETARQVERYFGDPERPERRAALVRYLDREGHADRHVSRGDGIELFSVDIDGYAHLIAVDIGERHDGTATHDGKAWTLMTDNAMMARLMGSHANECLARGVFVVDAFSGEVYRYLSPEELQQPQLWIGVPLHGLHVLRLRSVEDVLQELESSEDNLAFLEQSPANQLGQAIRIWKDEQRQRQEARQLLRADAPVDRAGAIGSAETISLPESSAVLPTPPSAEAPPSELAAGGPSAASDLLARIRGSRAAQLPLFRAMFDQMSDAMLRRFLQVVEDNVKPGDAVLEVGPGPSYVFSVLAAYQGASVKGVDVSKDAIDRHQTELQAVREEVAKTHHGALDYQWGDIRQRWTSENSQDVVMAMGVLGDDTKDKSGGRLVQRDKIVEAMIDMLRPGGRLLVGMYFRDEVDEVKAVIARVLQREKYRGYTARLVREYDLLEPTDAESAFSYDYDITKPAVIGEEAIERAKREAGVRAVQDIREGMVVGLGTGTTATYAIAELGRLLKEGALSITAAIPTSAETEEQARRLDIPLATLEAFPEIDLVIDGADAMDLGRGVMIKGRGGALLTEKRVMERSRQITIVVDERKLKDIAQEDVTVPLEVQADKQDAVVQALAQLGYLPIVRTEIPAWVRERGDGLVDIWVPSVPDARQLEARLMAIDGVVDTGIFTIAPTTVIVGSPEGRVDEYQADAGQDAGADRPGNFPGLKRLWEGAGLDPWKKPLARTLVSGLLPFVLFNIARHLDLTLGLAPHQMPALLEIGIILVQASRFFWHWLAPPNVSDTFPRLPSRLLGGQAALGRGRHFFPFLAEHLPKLAAALLVGTGLIDPAALMAQVLPVDLTISSIGWWLWPLWLLAHVVTSLHQLPALAMAERGAVRLRGARPATVRDAIVQFVQTQGTPGEVRLIGVQAHEPRIQVALAQLERQQPRSGRRVRWETLATPSRLAGHRAVVVTWGERRGVWFSRIVRHNFEEVLTAAFSAFPADSRWDVRTLRPAPRASFRIIVTPSPLVAPNAGADRERGAGQNLAGLGLGRALEVLLGAVSERQRVRLLKQLQEVSAISPAQVEVALENLASQDVLVAIYDRATESRAWSGQGHRHFIKLYDRLLHLALRQGVEARMATDDVLGRVVEEQYQNLVSHTPFGVLIARPMTRPHPERKGEEQRGLEIVSLDLGKGITNIPRAVRTHRRGPVGGLALISDHADELVVESKGKRWEKGKPRQGASLIITGTTVAFRLWVSQVSSPSRKEGGQAKDEHIDPTQTVSERGAVSTTIRERLSQIHRWLQTQVDRWPGRRQIAHHRPMQTTPPETAQLRPSRPLPDVMATILQRMVDEEASARRLVGEALSLAWFDWTVAATVRLDRTLVAQALDGLVRIGALERVEDPVEGTRYVLLEPGGSPEALEPNAEVLGEVISMIHGLSDQPSDEELEQVKDRIRRLVVGDERGADRPGNFPGVKRLWEGVGLDPWKKPLARTSVSGLLPFVLVNIARHLDLTLGLAPHQMLALLEIGIILVQASRFFWHWLAPPMKGSGQSANGSTAIVPRLPH